MGGGTGALQVGLWVTAPLDPAIWNRSDADTNVGVGNKIEAALWVPLEPRGQSRSNGSGRGIWPCLGSGPQRQL